MELVRVDRENLRSIIETILEYAEKSDTSINHLYPYQKRFAARIISSVINNDGDAILGEWARQSGKSSTLGCICPPMMAILPELAKEQKYQGTTLSRFAGGLKVGIFAPSKFQASNLYRKMKRNIRSKGFFELLDALDLEVSSASLDGFEFSNFSFVMVQSASTESKIESSTYDLVIADEAQAVDAEIMRRSIHPMLAATNGTIVKIGSAIPDISNCDFYECIQLAKTKKNNKNYFHFDADVAKKYNALYAKYLEKEATRIGAHSPEFRMSYYLEWPTEKGMFVTEDQFYGRGDWEGKGIVGTHSWIPEKRSGVQVAGLDWAKNLGDSVLTIGDIRLDTVFEMDDEMYACVDIINVLMMHGDDYVSQREEVVEFLRSYNIQRLHMDATSGSVGDPLFDQFSRDPRLFHIEVSGVPFTTPVKSGMYKHAQQELQAGRVKIAGSSNSKKTRFFSEYRRQLTGLVKKHTLAGHLVVNKNPQVKNAKDDMPDSLVLCLDAVKNFLSYHVEVEDNMLMGRNVDSTKMVGLRRMQGQGKPLIRAR